MDGLFTISAAQADAAFGEGAGAWTEALASTARTSAIESMAATPAAEAGVMATWGPPAAVAASGFAGYYGGLALADHVEGTSKGHYGIDPATGLPRSMWDQVALEGREIEAETGSSVLGGLTAAGLAVGGTVVEGARALVE